MGVALEETKKRDDTTIKLKNDLIIIMDPVSAKRLSGTIVEYYDSWHGKGFRLRKKYSC